MSVTNASESRSVPTDTRLFLALPSTTDLVPMSPDVVVSPTPVPIVRNTFRFRRALKRAIDCTVAALLLLMLAPVLAIVAVLVRGAGDGPALFRQHRVGRDGVEFGMYKFRTMCVDAEDRLNDLLEQNEAAGPLFKLRTDPRVTRIGAFLRRTSIDEIPQLWNVVMGDMSLVGPRPALPREVLQWEGRAFGRLAVKPGITGAWQVNGRSDLTWEEGLRLDLDYAANWTIATDIAILARTVPIVLRSHGAY